MWDFRIRNEQPSLSLTTFALEIPAGTVTVLVGPSGSGKSTIIGLLERWYGPNTGSVALDGIDIQEIDLKWLSCDMGLVQQVRSKISLLLEQN